MDGNDQSELKVRSAGMMSTEIEAVRVVRISKVTDIAAGCHVSASFVARRNYNSGSSTEHRKLRLRSSPQY